MGRADPKEEQLELGGLKFFKRETGKVKGTRTGTNEKETMKVRDKGAEVLEFGRSEMSEP